MLPVKLETTHKSAKPPTNQPNCPQTIRKPVKLATSQLNHRQITQITHKPPKASTNQPQTSQATHKAASHNDSIIWKKKTVFYVTKNFSNNAKHVLSLQPCPYIDD